MLNRHRRWRGIGQTPRLLRFATSFLIVVLGPVLSILCKSSVVWIAGASHHRWNDLWNQSSWGYDCMVLLIANPWYECRENCKRAMQAVWQLTCWNSERHWRFQPILSPHSISRSSHWPRHEPTQCLFRGKFINSINLMNTYVSMKKRSTARPFGGTPKWKDSKSSVTLNDDINANNTLVVDSILRRNVQRSSQKHRRTQRFTRPPEEFGWFYIYMIKSLIQRRHAGERERERERDMSKETTYLRPYSRMEGKTAIVIAGKRVFDIWKD